MLKAFTRGPELDITRFYMGNLVSFLAKNEDTDGRVAIIEGEGRIGNEPPPHVHEWEHEIYYVLDGEIEFFCEGQEGSIVARAGQLAFIPQGKAHAMYFRSPTFRTLIIVVATGTHDTGTVGYFNEVSEPAKSMELPKEAIRYVTADEDIDQLVATAARYGTQALSPSEVTERLPFYPGFGANLKETAPEQGKE